MVFLGEDDAKIGVHSAVGEYDYEVCHDSELSYQSEWGIFE